MDGQRGALRIEDAIDENMPGLDPRRVAGNAIVMVAALSNQFGLRAERDDLLRNARRGRQRQVAIGGAQAAE